jgi:hypothetical protein
VVTYDQEGAIGLLSRMLASSTRLPAAACKGRPDLFDPPGEDEPRPSVIRRHEAAARLCRFTCPALAECQLWLEQLPRPQRPAGVVAGHRPHLPASPGRPKKGIPA